MRNQESAGLKLVGEPAHGDSKEKHRFFLRPYEDAAFTKRPKCESKTKLRKSPLVIHIEPGQLFVLNKHCRQSQRPRQMQCPESRSVRGWFYPPSLAHSTSISTRKK